MTLWNRITSPLPISATYIRIALLAFAVSAQGAYAAELKWDWKTAASNDNWQSFFKLSDLEKAQTWTALTQRGIQFEDLSWQWKLAWVKSCTFSSTKDCSYIIQNGLFDKALVVRAEAAGRLGQRFADTGHAPAIRLLRTAYAVQQNSRAKEPLFVQYRILQALSQIGGEGLVVGKELAMKSNSLHKYWTRIASAQ